MNYCFNKNEFKFFIVYLNFLNIKFYIIFINYKPNYLGFVKKIFFEKNHAPYNNY